MFARIMPFVILGMLIVLLIYTLIFLSQVFIIGTIIGLIVYLFAAIRLRWIRWESSKN